MNNTEKNKQTVEHLKCIIASIEEENEKVMKQHRSLIRIHNIRLKEATENNDFSERLKCVNMVEIETGRMEEATKEIKDKLRLAVKDLKEQYKPQKLKARDVRHEQQDQKDRNEINKNKFDNAIRNMNDIDEWKRTQSTPVKTSKLKKRTKKAGLLKKFGLRYLPSFSKPKGL